jgi:hypothetical protein
MDDFDDNIFDDDDALDYIMSEEVEKGSKEPQSSSGCFGVLLVLIVPVILFGQLIDFLL